MSDDLQKKVAARIAAEQEAARAAGADGHAGAAPAPLTDDELWAYLRENRLGDAKLYCRLHRGTVVYVTGWDRWLVWTGHHWAEDEFDLRYQKVDAVCDCYLAFAERKRAEAGETDDKTARAILEAMVTRAERRIDQLRDRNGQDNLMAMVRRTPEPLAIAPRQLDTHPYLKACPNGVIDLRTGQIHDGRPEEYLLNAMPTRYRPELLETPRPCPETEAFLLSSMDGDQTIVDFLWRLLGYGLITKRKDHIFVIFHGAHGRNGKDTLIKLVTHVLGNQLSGDVAVEMLLQTPLLRSSSAPAPDVMQLRGMCLAWINEAEENQRFALARLKKLTGGGFISARGLQDKAITTWEQTHLPIMTTNELPKAKSDDAAFWQRALIVRWELSFVNEPAEFYERLADKDLEEKVKAEAEGVLARLVRGALDYLRDGLQIPDKVKRWTQGQRTEWDDLGEFLEDCCVMEPRQENPESYETRIPAADLYEAYCLWYAETKDRRYTISAKKFAGMCNRKEIPSRRSNGIWRLGVILNDEWRAKLDEARDSDDGRFSRKRS